MEQPGHMNSKQEDQEPAYLFNPAQSLAQVDLDATGSDTCNGAKQNKYGGKTEDETQGVQQNRQANLGIRMFIIKLAERQPGDVGQVRGDQR